MQRHIANFVFGVMNSDGERGKSYLLNVENIERTNANTIATFFNDSLAELYPEGIQYAKVLLVVTDAAGYIISAMKNLQVLYCKMIHITCFAHGFHRLAETVRSLHSNVDLLISSVKAVFVKVMELKCPMSS